MDRKKEKFLKIGIFVDTLLSGYHQFIWKYIQLQTDRRKISVQCFSIGVLGQKADFLIERNRVLELVNPDELDAGIVFSSLIGRESGESEALDLISGIIKVPVVNAGSISKKYPSVILDNASGVKELIDHCLDVHKYSNYLIIRGPEHNSDAEDRYSAMLENLKKKKININRDVISFTWEYTRVNENLNEIVHLIKKKKNIDAILAFDDEIAIMVSDALKLAGMDIENQPALLGFDNIPEYIRMFPGLTTVNQPIDLLVKNCFDIAGDLILGKQVEQLTKIPTRAVIRTSCGCRHWKVADPDLLKIMKDFLENRMPELCCRYFEKDMGKEWTESLVRLFGGAVYKDIISSSESNFSITIIDSFLSETFSNGIGNQTWMDFIDDLENSLSRIMTSESNLIKKRDILYHIRNTLFDFKENIKMYTDEQKASLSANMRFISDGFLAANSFPELSENLVTRLPHLNTRAFQFYIRDEDSNDSENYLAIFFNGHKKNSYTIRRNPGTAAEAYSFFLDECPGKAITLVMALYHRDIFQGYAMYLAENRNSSFYETVSSQASNAINSINQFKKIRIYSDNLEDQVRERTTILNKAMTELESANEQLKNIDKIKNDFILNITHDFRSPLTVINNLAELAILYNDEIDAETRENFELILTSGIQLKKYIDQLLELSRIDARGLKLKISSIQLNKFLSRLAAFYKLSVAGSSIQIECDLPRKDIQIYTDGEKLEDVLHNIVSNAVKFVSNRSGVIKIQLQEKDNNVRISIIDNGIGIEKKYLNTIFDRFEQIEYSEGTKHRSTGIGLAYALQLVTALKGRIWAESEGKDRGSVFNIEFPKGTRHLGSEKFEFGAKDIIINDEIGKIIQYDILHKDYEAQDQKVVILKTLNRESEFDYKKAIILIAEDDINIRKIIQEFLKRAGYINFLLAANGREAFELFQDYHPDMLISDLNMPIMMGDELHDRILQTDEGMTVPFIFLSAISDQQISIKRKEKGAIDYLKKPIDKDDLLATVNQHLKRYFRYKEQVYAANAGK